ncbi:hypothetical protein C8R45DRAFT_1137385 [Mycena sanguinolenta]|nr:hypothetical protein C8R45DRAFT_1137385 [Mycena sanguinolenta]
MDETNAKKRLRPPRSYSVPPPAPISPEIIAGEPILPPELEREIFELTAVTPNYWTKQHVDDMTLILPQVCRRTQSWIEPLIYERIAFSKSTLVQDNFERRLQLFLETMNTRPASFFAANVKYLYFGPSVQLPIIRRVLSVCTGVVSVGCHHSHDSVSDSLAPLPLQRLLLSKFVLPVELPPWTTSLTHLGLLDTVPNDHAQVFGALPALTHLAIDCDTVNLNPLCGTLHSLLRACPRLRCIVLAATRGYARRLHKENFNDPRVCLLGHWPIESGWSRRPRELDLFQEANARLKV